MVRSSRTGADLAPSPLAERAEALAERGPADEELPNLAPAARVPGHTPMVGPS
ncbi:hypothetical protein ACGF5C_27725 [Micromonospora sp. NPDC047620]|uniref:hypothetical protein n=1 Tax=Micromonospora sp. NPDC047620 TaxID=3364251 RepID=UPI00371E2501